MTRQGLPKVSIPIAVLLLATAALAAQSGKQEKDGSATLQLPIVGTAATGRTFAGTLSIQSFEARGDKVVAIGMVTGTVAGVGTALVGPVTLPVEVGAGSQGAAAPSSAVTAQATCQVLHLDLGAVNLNLLGVQVTTLPIAIDLSGDSAAPLGNLVCTIVATLNNVVGLVGLLNQLLGVVTGLVGGLIP
jgi:hypothetical protein